MIALAAVYGASEGNAKAMSDPAATPPSALEQPLLMAMQVTVSTGHRERRGYSPSTRRTLPSGDEGGGVTRIQPPLREGGGGGGGGGW